MNGVAKNTKGVSDFLRMTRCPLQTSRTLLPPSRYSDRRRQSPGSRLFLQFGQIKLPGRRDEFPINLGMAHAWILLMTKNLIPHHSVGTLSSNINPATGAPDTRVESVDFIKPGRAPTVAANDSELHLNGSFTTASFTEPNCSAPGPPAGPGRTPFRVKHRWLFSNLEIGQRIP